MIVLYWRVYVAIRSRRRSASTSSARSQQLRLADESISCMATGAPPPPPSTIEPRRGEVATRGVTGGDGDATLSAVAATLNDVQRRGRELALRVSAAVDGTATVGKPGESLPPGDGRCRTPLPSIAVVDTDDVAEVTAPTASDGVAIMPATIAETTPTTVAVDACGLDCTVTLGGTCMNRWCECEMDINA